MSKKRLTDKEIRQKLSEAHHILHEIHQEVYARESQPWTIDDAAKSIVSVAARSIDAAMDFWWMKQEIKG